MSMQRGQINQTNTTEFTGAGDTVVLNEALLVINKASGAATGVTLPPGSSQTYGRTVTIKDGKGDAGSNNITITAAGSDTIDGSATYVVGINYGSVELMWNGDQWLATATVGTQSGGSASRVTSSFKSFVFSRIHSANSTLIC